MSGRTRPPAALLMCLGLLLGLLALPGAPLLLSAVAGATADARSAAEVYERKTKLIDCLEYVAKDLKTRAAAAKSDEPAVMLLAIDHTQSMANEIETLRLGLNKAWAAGPPGMRIGVYGVGSGEYVRPTRVPRGPDGALGTLAFLPADGPKNVQAAIREAAKLLSKEGGSARALVLVTEESGEGEDNVEKTRDALFDADTAFYCIAGEAAFERSWIQDFKPRGQLAAAGLTERLNPRPRKRAKNELFFGGETAIGLVPYRWEFDLAQIDFIWIRPPRYPVPSGFGYWALATLCHATGGRYFIFDFPATNLGKRQNAKRRSFYEFSRLTMLAPDLRPRTRILKDLQRDARAQAIVRIWDHLADESRPILQVRGNLERRGTSLSWRPAAQVRSQVNLRPWYEEMDHVREAKELAKGRVRCLETALGWWRTADAKERKIAAGKNTLSDRVEADFQLMGVNLKKVHFQWSEALAAIESIKQIDVTYRRSRIVPRQLMRGLDLPRTGASLGDETREARLAEVVRAQKAFAKRYAGTPWGLIISKGRLFTFVKDVRVIEEPPERARPDRKKDRDGKKKEAAKPPRAPRPTPAPPPPGPRPGSGSGGPTTGG